MSGIFVGFKGGLLMSMIAFSVVFIIICGLMFVMMGLHKICSAIDNASKAKSKAAPALAPVPAAQSNVSSVAQTTSDEDELIAVLAAAAAMMCGTEARVISFTPSAKAPKRTLWSNLNKTNNFEGICD